jgi:hypothetical protein
VRGLQGEDLGDLPGQADTPAAAAPAKNAAVASPRARNCFSAAVLARGARRGLSGRADP